MSPTAGKRGDGKGDKLLEGEDPETRHPDDAEHWFKVYTELVQTKAELLSALTTRLAEIETDESRGELAQSDIPTLQGELDRFQRRLDFWREKWDEVRG